MNELPITLCGSRCLVVGYGRIGKCLAKMLQGIGACVTVSARSLGDMAMIRAFGYKAVHTAELASIAGDFDLIINTVPHKVINESVIERINRETLVIDLASKPGGVDMDAAKKFGIRVIWALSLPGKVAPVTAGKIICDTVINIINELGV